MIMEVTTGSAWQTSSGYRREYRMTLNEQDLIERYGMERVMAMKPNEKRKRLNLMADMMVVTYMTEEGEYAPDKGRKRIEEINGKLIALDPKPAPAPEPADA